MHWTEILRQKLWFEESLIANLDVNRPTTDTDWKDCKNGLWLLLFEAAGHADPRHKNSSQLFQQLALCLRLVDVTFIGSQFTQTLLKTGRRKNKEKPYKQLQQIRNIFDDVTSAWLQLKEPLNSYLDDVRAARIVNSTITTVVKTRKYLHDISTEQTLSDCAKLVLRQYTK